jgi:hypothetical protein
MTMATRKRHTPEQVVRKLAQADRMLGEGKPARPIRGDPVIEPPGRPRAARGTLQLRP